MAEEKEKTSETAKTSEEKTVKQPTDKAKAIEIEYDVESLANSGLFNSKSIVRAALRNAGKKKATIAEAQKLVEEF